MYKKIFRYLALVILFSPALVAAADLSSSALIEELQGVYKFRFKNALVSGERYQSEDIVEIVPFDDSHIYIRAALQFANGHSCGIWGIAGYEKGSFVYRDPSKPIGNDLPCALKISTTEKNLTLSDVDNEERVSTCRAYCGARGSLSDYSIARSLKSKIHYMERLKASSQYQAAVNAFKSQGSAN